MYVPFDKVEPVLSRMPTSPCDSLFAWTYCPLVEYSELLESKLSITPLPLMRKVLRETIPRLPVLVATGCAITSMVRDARGVVMAPPPLRSKWRLIFLRSLSSFWLGTRGGPGAAAIPVERMRYHCKPFVS